MILTIGHSTRSLEDLIAILQAHGVDLLVDVRTVPKSRHNPQFNAENLAAPLRQAGIEYLPMPKLGGLRHARKDSPNTGWRNLSFRGYADYMQTPDFEAALDDLLQVSEGRRSAVMCAEAVPWRCHRSLIADALAARGIPVEHIMSITRRDAHHMTGFARVKNGRVTYPGEDVPQSSAAGGSARSAGPFGDNR